MYYDYGSTSTKTLLRNDNVLALSNLINGNDTRFDWQHCTLELQARKKHCSAKMTSLRYATPPAGVTQYYVLIGNTAPI